MRKNEERQVCPRRARIVGILVQYYEHDFHAGRSSARAPVFEHGSDEMTEYLGGPLTEAALELNDKKPIRVLHVDDELGMLTLAKQLLEMESSFRVDTALSVEEALNKLKKETYDVIVSDYRMPVRDGLQFLKELRQEGNTIPFVILTGRGMEEVAIEALNLGADYYVNKAVNHEMMFNELANDIRKAVERRRARLAAWVRQEKMKAIFDSSPNPIMIVDLQENIVECNQKTLLLNKLSSKKEVIGRSVLELVEERDRRRVSEKLKKALEQGFVKDIEFGLSTKYGAGYVGEISAGVIKDSSGEPTSLVVIMNDITERKQAENKLRQYSKRLEENQRFLEDIFSAFPDAVTVCDLNGNIIKCNQATLDLHGYSSKDELIGVNVRALLTQRDRERALGELNKVKVLDSVKNVEYAMLGREGNEFPAELSVGAIMNSQRKSLGLVVITKDITCRKRLQEQLIVSEKLAAVGELAASFSHDIRNPLAVIKNSVCFLEMKLKENTDDKVMKHLSILKEEINYAGLLVNNLLDFAKKNPPHLHGANVNEVVKGAISYVAIPENIKLVFKPSEIPPMLIDEAQLKRVFTNMILNATQAMSNGGKLTVQTTKDHDFAEIMFSDTGVGIPEENMQKMFIPFFSTKANGVGLGLSICKQIIEDHGGIIAVRSKEGEGSTFIIRLPIHTEEMNVELTSPAR